MAITTLDGLVAGFTSGQRRAWQKAAQTGGGAGGYVSLFKTAGTPSGASTTPTGTGEIPTNATAGALGFTNPSGGNLAYLAQCSIACHTTGTVTIYDRLWHNSGLSGTVITAQTVNSLALTRPDAVGSNVECWLECNTVTGTTARTLTVSYTDAVNGAGRSGTIAIPASMPANRMIPMTNQSGDYGVKSIQSCTLSATTGTAGDFGLVLLRRIVDIPTLVADSGVDRDAFALGLPQIYSGACLAILAFCSAATQGPWHGLYSIAVG
jgi:hypothetical protein